MINVTDWVNEILQHPSKTPNTHFAKFMYGPTVLLNFPYLWIVYVDIYIHDDVVQSLEDCTLGSSNRWAKIGGYLMKPMLCTAEKISKINITMWAGSCIHVKHNI